MKVKEIQDRIQDLVKSKDIQDEIQDLVEIFNMKSKILPKNSRCQDKIQDLAKIFKIQDFSNILARYSRCRTLGTKHAIKAR